MSIILVKCFVFSGDIPGERGRAEAHKTQSLPKNRRLSGANEGLF